MVTSTPMQAEKPAYFSFYRPYACKSSEEAKMAGSPLRHPVPEEQDLFKEGFGHSLQVATVELKNSEAHCG